METRKEGKFGAAMEAKECLTALSPIMRNQGVSLLILGPERSPLGDLLKTPEEAAIGEAERIISPFLMITLSSLLVYQERVEAWAHTIDQDVPTYGGRGEAGWKITKTKKDFSMARRFVW